MTRRLACVVALIAACGLALLPGVPARGQSIGVSPTELEVADALRNGEYTRTLTIINQRSEPLLFLIAVEGEAASWITLYDQRNPSIPVVDRVNAPGSEDTRVIARIQIPDDAPNRLHSAEIALQSVAPEEEQGAPVTGGFQVGVLIYVTGTQHLEGVVSAVSVRDTEVGLPLRVDMDFQNTGNVKAEPEVHLQISDSSANPVATVVDKDQVVDVEASANLEAEWDTSGQVPGPYLLNVAVLLGETEIHSEALEFELFPEGTLTRRGVLDGLVLANAPYPGALAKIIALFRNTGEIDTRGAFLGEVYRGDMLIDTASSSEVLAEVGQVVELEILVPVEERGEYTVRGLVNYEGKETESREVTFKVPPDLGSGGFLGRSWWQVAAVGLLILAIAFAGATEVRRRSRRSDST